MGSGRIRLGYLITDLQVGGAERAVSLLARGLPRDAFDVSVACLFGREPVGSEIEGAGIPVVDLHVRGRLDVGGIARCRAWIRRHRIEILHAYLFHANLLSRIAIPRGCLLLNSQRNSGGEPAARRALARATARRVAGFTALSEDARRYLVREIGIPPGHIEVIRNGIDLAAFDRAADAAPPAPPGGPADGLPRIGTVGQMRRDGQKGYPVLLEAFGRVTARRAAHLLVCGDGAGRPEVEATLRREGLESRVHLLGERRDVPALLRSLDLYVQASRWEGLPHAVLDAMAARLPVVATRVGGIPEMVEDGRTGILVPRDDPEALAGAILDLIDDPGRARRLGEAGRERVRREFRADRTIEAHRRLYRRLAGRPRPRGRITDPRSVRSIPGS